jgi:hypothetical protein
VRTARALGLTAALLLAAAAAAAPPAESPLAQSSSPGKPTAPIAIDVALAAEPALGVLLDVTITARATDVRDLSLEARAVDAAALLVAARTVAADAGGGRAWTVTVLPIADGVAYLGVEVSGLLGGTEVSRNLLVPVRVGGARRKIRAAAAGNDAEAGERLVVLPAQETAGPQPE